MAHEMNMKECSFSGEQEKCPHYEKKCDELGKVDLTCRYFRENFLGKNGGSICDQEWGDGKNENTKL